MSTADGSVIHALRTLHAILRFIQKLPLKFEWKFHTVKSVFDSNKCYVLKSNHLVIFQKLHFFWESQAVSLTLSWHHNISFIWPSNQWYPSQELSTVLYEEDIQAHGGKELNNKPWVLRHLVYISGQCVDTLHHFGHDNDSLYLPKRLVNTNK